MFIRKVMRLILTVFGRAALLVLMAVTVGSVCALFLWLLEKATELRFMHPSLLYFLPFGGVVVALLYFLWGGRAEGGSHLIIAEIHKPGSGVPLRMAPFVLLGTVISHLFGASVGREGTAVQIGGSLASSIGKLCRLDEQGTRIFLMAGVAAGFGAVFGTPGAGAVFSVELLTLGWLAYSAFLPVAVASFIADWTCRYWGIEHIAYHVSAYGVDVMLMSRVAFASIFFGLLSRVFVKLVYYLSHLMKKIVPQTWLRPAFGGVLIIVLVWGLGTRDYLGLGVTAPEPYGASIVNFFGTTCYVWSWFLKLVFTAIALSTGYKGGEVTPLFFIGAAAGNVLAPIMHVSVDLLAGIGLVAVFAGAANTPLACIFMAVELFGEANVIYYAVGCFVAYLVSGRTGIYLSQRFSAPGNL